MPDTGWETVIGLEVHCELQTATKLFCGCANHFGDEPNTNICPVCLGLPGSLPVLNEQVVELAIRLGRALHCEVRRSIFARKNYFYPDMPKDYQISQYDLPINVAGWLELASGQRIGITRAHLEEDTGKSTHMAKAGQTSGGRIHDAGHTLIDYNRAGVPLLEIVSEPDMRTSDDARAYVNELRAILLATAVSDAKMEEGSMRVDANVSVRRGPDQPFGTRCEIKNLNSIRSLGRAIDYEVRRQIDLLEAGERIIQQTRHWNEDEGRTHTLRTKEEAEDYRYFPEPDLVPLDPGPEWIARVDGSLALLPAERRARLAEAASVDGAANGVAIAVERGLDDLALDAIAAGGDPARVLVHVEHNLADGAPITAAQLAALVRMEVGGELTATQAKDVLAEVVATGGEPADIAKAKGYEAMGAGALVDAVDAVLAAHPAEWDRFLAGDEKERKKLAGMFIGQVMKATNGQADGKAVTALLAEKAG
jgi:aspartyl-tRNA(Asn)/glutamyl-tRNA(Gln) amidotransferase subunit B